MGKINIFVGHYGSGKSEIALNYALLQKSKGKKVMLVDLDIVNPYFCLRELKELLQTEGIKLISADPSLSNAELMVVPKEVIEAFSNEDYEVIFDIGGDDSGSIVLGRYKNYFNLSNHEVFFVMNNKRPLTSDFIKAEKYLKDIETTSRLKVSSIISNANLSYETDIQDIIKGEEETIKLADKVGIPHKFTVVRKDFEKDLKNVLKASILPIDIYMKPFWREF